MKQKQIFKWINLMVAIGLGACTAGIGQSTTGKAKFTDRYWTLSALKAEPALDWDLDGIPETDILKKLEDCERDDAIMFTSDHVVMEHRGSEHCDEEDDLERETGTWDYDGSSDALIVATDGHEPQHYQVVEARGDKLVLTHRVEARNTKHVLTATYVAK